eukprot:666899_1
MPKNNPRMMHSKSTKTINKTRAKEDDKSSNVLIALGKPMTIPHLKGRWNDLLPNLFPPSSPHHMHSRPASASDSPKREQNKNRHKMNGQIAMKPKNLGKSQSSVMFCSFVKNNNQNAAKKRTFTADNNYKMMNSPLHDPSFCKIKQLIHTLSKNNVRSLESLHQSINRARSVPSNKYKKKQNQNEKDK